MIPQTSHRPPAPESFSTADVAAFLRRCGQLVRRHQAYLTRLDVVLGDGDHGENLVIGFRAVDRLLAELEPGMSPGGLLRAAGHRLVSSVGGASGPLYGTAFIEAGLLVGDAERIPTSSLGALLDAAARGLARRGRCAVGDKTILDTLRPAADALADVVPERPFGESFRHVVIAGRRGMLSTRPLIARRGLALRLGPRSVGHLDPGAVSCLLMLLALAPAREGGHEDETVELGASPSTRAPAEAPR